MPRPATPRPGLAATDVPALDMPTAKVTGPTVVKEPLLSLCDVAVGIRQHRHAAEIVRGVDLEVYAGEKLGIVGESGSGKTLTVLSVLRLLPDPPLRLLRGEINFAGKNLSKLDEKSLEKIRGAEIAMVYQDPMTSLNPLLRVRTQIVETLRPTVSTTTRPTPVAARYWLKWVFPTRHVWNGPSRTSSRAACCSG